MTQKYYARSGYRWSILLLGALVITACGGNQHGPTSYTYRENDLTQRRDAGNRLASQAEAEAKARDREIQNAYRNSGNSTGLSGNEFLSEADYAAYSGSSGGSYNSSIVSTDNLAAIGMGMLPMLMAGVMSGGLKSPFSGLTGTSANSNAAQREASSGGSGGDSEPRDASTSFEAFQVLLDKPPTEALRTPDFNPNASRDPTEIHIDLSELFGAGEQGATPLVVAPAKDEDCNQSSGSQSGQGQSVVIQILDSAAVHESI